MTLLLLLCSLAQAVSGDELRRGIDRRVVLIDADGRQIDCALVEVEAERLIIRFEDGSLAQVPRSEVVNLVDLGPAPPPPEVPVVEEPEPEDDFGEEALDEDAEDGFDVDDALDELLGEDGASDDVTPPVEEADEPAEEPVVERIELPEDTLDALPEPDEPVDVVEEAVVVDADPDEDPFAEPEVEEAEEVEEVEEVDEVEEAEDLDEDAIADLGPPDVDDKELARQQTELYYAGRADGATAARDADFKAATGIGYGAGCVGACLGCGATTLAYSVFEPTVPGGSWQESEDVYQQGYIQAYRSSYQREAAKRAFIGGTLGTATFAIVATVAVSQLL